MLEALCVLPLLLQQPALPTPEQAQWQDLELGMFVHFAPNTWQDQEYDDMSTPLDRLNPDRLYPSQWAAVASSMGAQYLVFVAKHAGGFCWWPTTSTEYCVRNTPWLEGKGDVLRDISDACRKYKLKLGVYLSPADRAHGAEGGGKCATPELQEAYNRVYRQQLTEVLSGYGDIAEVWFDGSIVVPVGDILQQYAPHAVVFQGPHASIRWVGNEDGIAPDPCWNGADSAVEAVRLGIATAAEGTPDGDRWLPVECDARSRDAWFWNSRNADSLKSVDQLMEIYEASVGHGANLLLNFTPDRSGLIPTADARRATAFGNEIRRRYGHSLAEAAGGAETVLNLDPPATVDAVVSMEDLAGGQRVRAYQVEGRVDGQWRSLCQGTAIGHKKIDRFEPVTVSALRLRATDSSGTPRIRRFAAFSTAPEPAPEQPDFRKLGEFGPEQFGTDWTTYELDLTSELRAAGHYELLLRETGGEGKLVVQVIVLLFDGAEKARYLRAPGAEKSYRLEIPATSARIVARITAKAPRGARGDILLRPLPQPER